jgi:hypothetical protein
MISASGFGAVCAAAARLADSAIAANSANATRAWLRA